MKLQPFFGRNGEYLDGCFLVFLVAILFSLQPVSAFQQPKTDFKCYVCTSDQPNCEENVDPSYAQNCYKSVVGCAIYAFDYEFVVGTLFHRACVYSVDLNSLIKSSPLKNGGFVWEKERISYKKEMDSWTRERQGTGVGFPPRVMNAPLENGYFHAMTYHDKGVSVDNQQPLSNSISLSEWKKTWKIHEKPAPQIKEDITCYSCDVEIKGVEMKVIDDAVTNNKAFVQASTTACGDNHNPPKITCKNAYGCATIWEMTDAKHQSDTNKRSRIWRGCWYPGELACLRKIKKIIARNLRLSSNTSLADAPAKGRKERKDCGRAYQRSVELDDGVVVWDGTKTLKYPEEYNQYLECRHEARLGVGAQSELKLVTGVVQEKEITIQYYFCGAKANCNVSPPKPPPEVIIQPGGDEDYTDEDEGPDVDEGNCKKIKDGDKDGAATISNGSEAALKIIFFLLLAHI